MRRTMMKWTALAAAGILLSACGGGDDDPGNLAEEAKSRGFTALLAAADKAGLNNTLTTGSNLTVFAPTDAAFTTLATQLGFSSATAMVQALPASALASILTYHVLPTRKVASDLSGAASQQATAYSFAGSPATLTVSASAGTVTITDAVLTQAKVTAADVHASNGVIHAVDKVLVPPGVLTVVQMAQANPAFTTLVSAVGSAGLAGTLSGTGPFTVFAPTNDAFTAIASTVASLSTAQLTTVLTYHVLAGQVLSTGIPFGTPVATVSGQTITIESGTPPKIADTTSTRANIAAVDIRASNGVIHVVDKVLIPTL